ncbi:MAG: hypothetical protein WEB03_12690 [Nitriliruptor sp.]|uniref:hypothetical protein n=1 Tax=Nitriliruptor sp. TaxID=2448056 RepID=UPI00349FF09D
MSRGPWFAGLGAVIAVLLVARLLLRRPLFGDKARPLSATDAWLAGISIALLAFHCTAMFAPDAVATIAVLDGPAARVQDLGDPVGQAAYWLPAIAAVAAIRRLWWPAPVGATLALTAVGVTMYAGGFTLTEHVVTIVVAAVWLAVVATGLISRFDRTGHPVRAADRDRSAPTGAT